MKKTILIFAVIITFSSFIIVRLLNRNIETVEIELKYRDKELTSEENLLLNKIGLKVHDFKVLFGKIAISEIIPNSILVNKTTRKEKNGILFYGFKIGIKEYLLLKQDLNKMNLDLEISLNIPTYRWNDFKFPFYANRDTIIDFEKQVYKIYNTIDSIDFIEQIDYINHDKAVVKKVYEDWKLKYNIIPIWADNKDNILLIDTVITEDLVLDIFEGKRKCFPSIDRSINLGWETKESKMNEIRERFPLIDMFFYDD